MSALETLRPVDRLRYFAALFAPAEKREHVAALAAFHSELARIPFQVSEPLPGEIRLQWWRDVIAGERAAEAASHPVARALLAAMEECRLPAAPLLAMADARIFDLYHDPMPDVPALEAYLGETEAALVQLCALVLAPADAPRFAEAAGHAGMALGIARLLELAARHARQGRIHVPQTMLEAAGVDAAAVLNGDSAARGKVCAMMVALGREHLASFAKAARSMPAALRPAFLPAATLHGRLGRLERAGAPLFDAAPPASDARALLSMARRAVTGW